MKKAVLFVTFNRLDYVKESFECIRKAKPPRFYLASDGAREGIEGEKEIIQTVRDYVLNNIDWDCEVKTRFLDKNSGGCANGVSGAVTWFFENEEDGIILEDDCVSSKSFFSFCEELLDKYKDDKRVWHIAGDAACPDIDIKESYYFGKIMHCWGWASWADRWKNFKLDLSDYDKKNLKKFSKREDVQKFWGEILKGIQKHQIDSWAYPWTFWIVANRKYCINPVQNLVSNIGVNGMHYQDSKSPCLNKPVTELSTNLIHPDKICYNEKAIDYIYTEVCGINSFYKYKREKVFSIKDSQTHKILTLLGFKIKFAKMVKPSKNAQKECVIVIPIYKSDLSPEEKASLVQCSKILKNYDFCFIMPFGLDITQYDLILKGYDKRYTFIEFDKKFFESLNTYSNLMLNKNLYKFFFKYKYMLIYQLDAWVFEDKLGYWCKQGFDYIGAPWFEGYDNPKNNKFIEYSGNGGFSLRNVKSMYGLLSQKHFVLTFKEILHKYPKENLLKNFIRWINQEGRSLDYWSQNNLYEDCSIVNTVSKYRPDIKLATAQEAIPFSFEVQPEVLFKLNNNKLPFGCHAFMKYNRDFWKDYINIEESIKSPSLAE